MQFHAVHGLLTEDGFVHGGVLEPAVHHFGNDAVGLSRNGGKPKAARVGHHARIEQRCHDRFYGVLASQSGDHTPEELRSGATTGVVHLGGRKVFGAHVVVHHEPRAGSRARGIGHGPKASHAVVVECKQHIGPVQDVLCFSRIPIKQHNVFDPFHPIQRLVGRVGQQAGHVLAGGLQVAG